MPEWGIAEPSPPHLQISYSTDNLLLKFSNLHPSLATRNAPRPVPMFSVDLGVQHLGAHHSELCGQQHVLTLCFLPIGHVHRCQLEGAGLCFFIQAITFHSQGSANEDLSSLCHASYHSLQERSYSIFVISHWHSAECISHHIVRSILVF